MVLGRGAPDGDVHHAVVLVEAIRIGGVPKQRHIAYLGSLMESEFNHIGALAVFWESIAAKLDALGDRLTMGERRAIARAIGQRIPRVTHRQVRIAQRRAAQAVRSIGVTALR